METIDKDKNSPFVEGEGDFVNIIHFPVLKCCKFLGKAYKRKNAGGCMTYPCVFSLKYIHLIRLYKTIIRTKIITYL